MPKEPEGTWRPVRLRQETLRKYGHEVSPRTEAVLQEAMRAAKGHRRKIQRNYRMAYCATVTMHDHEGEALHTIRYGRMPAAIDSLEQLTHRDVHRMMQRLRDDVITIRRRAGPVPVVLLADGAPELWRLFEQHLCEKQLGAAPIKLVDAWHALEYIASAARLLESREKAWPGTFRRWKSWLLTEVGGAERVMHAHMSSELQNARDDAGKRPVGDAVRYIQARLALMNYADARRRGLPIGSGAVEATCKVAGERSNEAMRLAMEAPERERDPAAARAAVERPLGRGDAADPGSASQARAHRRQPSRALRAAA